MEYGDVLWDTLVENPGMIQCKILLFSYGILRKILDEFLGRIPQDPTLNPVQEPTGSFVGSYGWDKILHALLG